MLGDRFAIVPGEDNSVSRFMKETMRDAGQKEGENTEEANEKMKVMDMLLMFKDFDEKMLMKAVKDISS